MADKLPQNTSELLSEIDREWLELQKVIKKLTNEQMTAPDPGGWSPKDNLAHLATWMHIMCEADLNKKPLHEVMKMDAAILAGLDEDGENAILFERYRNLPTDEVLTWLDGTYAKVVETLKKKPFADLMKPIRDTDPGKRLVILSVLGNTSEHLVEHRQVIERNFKV
jgi:DinB superfamily